MTEIIIAVLGSQLIMWPLQFFVTRHYQRKDRQDERYDLVLKTLSVLTYNRLADKIEHLLNKGFATPDERRETELLHELYKEHGWNGDMDARMEKVHRLRTDRPEFDLSEFSPEAQELYRKLTRTDF